MYWSPQLFNHKGFDLGHLIIQRPKKVLEQMILKGGQIPNQCTQEKCSVENTD